MPKMEPHQVLQQAVNAHRAGRLDDAEKFYLSALKASPRNADALHFLGALRLQQGQAEEAVRLIGKAAIQRPNDLVILENHASALSSAGRFGEALERYDEILTLQPRSPQGLHGRALMLLRVNRYEDAITAFDKILAINPRDARLWFDRGNALAGARRFEEAVQALDRAHELAPGQPDILVNRGYALFQLDAHERAIESFDRALQIDPNSVLALSNRGNALKAVGRFDEALQSYERALAFAPDHADTLNNCGALLFERDRPADALRYFEKALELRPDDIDFINHRGTALIFLARDDEALANAEMSLKIKPDNFEPHAIFLQNGRLAEGFDLYEQRWSTGRHGSPRPYPSPMWQGAQIPGRLLVWAEQGLGDQILFASILGDLKPFADQIIVEIEPRLVSLFSRSFPGFTMIGMEKELYAQPVDANVALASLGKFFRRNWADFPKRPQGFLAADPERSVTLRQRMKIDARPVIGVSWHSKRSQRSQFKSAALSDFVPLFRSIEARWVDLQYGDTQDERSEFTGATGFELAHLDDIDNTNDLEGLSALISACDAVITVSNTTAHLAGALGRPTWVLAPFGNSRIWYWHSGKTDSPWYPGLRVRAQRMGQTFADLASEVAGEVSEFFGVKKD